MTTAKALNDSLPYATQEELDWLTIHAATLKPRAKVVMIGGGPCVMGLALLEGNASLYLHIIDIAPDNYCREHIAVEFPKASVAYFRMESIQVMLNDVEFIIIDGSHEYEDVLADCRVWLPRLLPNALAMFHDYDAYGTIFETKPQYPGVKQALNRYIKYQRAHYEIVEQVGTSAIVRCKA